MGSAKRLLRATGTYDVALRLYRAARRRTLPKPVEIRVDPVPAMQPFPKDVRLVFAVGAIPRQYAGRTASIFAKTKMFYEVAGVRSQILTMNYSGELDDVTRVARDRGALSEGVEVINLHEFFGQQSGPASDPITYPVEEPGMSSIRDRDQEVYRFFEGGIYRLYKRYDYAGRLIVRDHFNENRARTRRDEFYQNGSPRRVTFYDLHHNLPRQEVYYRADGTPYLTRWLVLEGQPLAPRVERLTLFDMEGKPNHVAYSDIGLVHAYLDRVVGDDRVILSVESRRADPETLSYERPNVKQVYVLHNPHIAAPFVDPKKVRPAYRPLLDNADKVGSVVFLTNAQRADAEARYGRRSNFQVIPHAVPKPTIDPSVTRDPRLVVMLARLDQQKRIPHAIKAFAKVLQRVPDARLDIYGRGPDQAALKKLIAELGVADSVRLRGYTTNPSEVYQTAAMSLLTSSYEGFGLVILESLGHGCPVVSYDLKYGPADLITDGENGFLVPDGNTTELAQRVISVLTAPGLQARLSRNAPDALKGFTPETFVARWSHLFNRLDNAGWPATGSES